MIPVDTGSSVLFGAYLAGLTLTYISRPPEGALTTPPDCAVGSQLTHIQRTDMLSFEAGYGRTISPLQNHILAPLFFASIGYAVVRTNI